MNPILAIGAVALMAIALLLIPIGLPGLWIMIALVAAGWMAGEVSVGVFLVLLAVAIAAEVAEWASVDRLGRRFGGTSRTFWGALIGGLVGAVAGAPIPVAGSIAGAFLGTLGGAILATWMETRRLAGSVRAGWGALLGRAVAVAIKVFAGLVILLVGGGALLLG
ncbi:MAG: DUF456 domain-containing protein [Gemmatimonadota bacterium]